MLSCSTRSRRQNCSLLLQHAYKRTPILLSPAVLGTRLVSVSASSGTYPIKYSIDSAPTGPAGTPRFCPVRLPPTNLSPTCTLIATTHRLLLTSLSTAQSDLGKKAQFSTSRTVMGAQKIDGTAIAKRIRADLHAEIQEKKKINPRYIPSLKIIQGLYTITEWQHLLRGFRPMLRATC